MTLTVFSLLRRKYSLKSATSFTCLNDHHQSNACYKVNNQHRKCFICKNINNVFFASHGLVFRMTLDLFDIYMYGQNAANHDAV